MTDVNTMPLAGVRVIDFTQVMMGPVATQTIREPNMNARRWLCGSLFALTLGLPAVEGLQNEPAPLTAASRGPVAMAKTAPPPMQRSKKAKPES